MSDSRPQSRRIPEAIAQRILDRAAAIDVDAVSLEELRQAAIEAGISGESFDIAVAEWQTRPVFVEPLPIKRSIMDSVVRNAASFVGGWLASALLISLQNGLGAPWQLQKMSEPIGMGIGVLLALKLRARVATVVLAGLTISQGTEFLLDLTTGRPAVHGFWPHISLMVVGIAGAAIVTHRWSKTGEHKGERHEREDSRSGRSGGVLLQSDSAQH